MPETRAAYDPAPDPERRARVERVVASYETLMHRVASTHAPEFLGVGVTMSQAKVLYLVQADPGLRMSELSARLGVSLSTVSGVVDRLVDQGLLNRRDDPADRRQVVLRITDAGTTQLELFRELNAGQFRDLLTRIDEADLEVVERALAILAAAAGTPRGAAAVTTPTTISGGTPS
ncbi:MAG TPA: MarR family transcriptional regulator [Candidatus Nanopelagicales bacterium]|nr:MarR family transcriptional regulator [Candidatus Nanopelagicales bacterium]